MATEHSFSVTIGGHLYTIWYREDTCELVATACEGRWTKTYTECCGFGSEWLTRKINEALEEHLEYFNYKRN